MEPTTDASSEAQQGLTKRQLRKLEKADRNKEFWKMKRKEKKERKKARKLEGHPEDLSGEKRKPDDDTRIIKN